MNAGRLLTALFVPLLLSLAPSSALAQGTGAADSRLRGVVFDSTSMAPLSGATVAVLGTSATTATDDDGAFVLDDVPAGSRSVSFFHRRLQELGVSAPVEPVDLRSGTTSEVTLAIPSAETLLEAWCLAEARGPDVARLAGVVRDTLTGVPLPRATVTLMPVDPETGVQMGVPIQRKTDDSGYYRFCDAPAGRVAVQPHFGLSGGVERTLVLRAGSPTVQDLQIVLSTVGQLQGRVTNYQGGEPLGGATVSLYGSDIESTTDAEGRFVLDSIPPGRHALETSFLGYETRMDSVTVFSSEAVGVDIRLTTEAIPIEGLVVTARGRLGDPLVDVGRRTDYMGRFQIDQLLPRVQNMHQLLDAARFPALDVREINMESAAGGRIQGLCIEAVRMRRQEGCRMVTVVIDGVPVQNPGERLQSYPPELIESIQYLGPMEATTRFGSAGGSGAVLITTRR